MPPEYRAVWFETLPSTSTKAFGFAEDGDAGRLWVAAEQQTEGRGRAGRHWVSEQGNLFASLLLRLSCNTAVLPQLSFVAGLAARDAILAMGGQKLDARELSLKWPNDILLSNAKVCGILVESRASIGSGEVTVVIGCGINLKSHPQAAGYRTGNLHDTGVEIGPRDALPYLAETLDVWLQTWNEGRNFENIRKNWSSQAAFIDRKIRAKINDVEVSGVFRGIDGQGRAMVELTDGSMKHLVAGEISLQPATPV